MPGVVCSYLRTVSSRGPDETGGAAPNRMNWPGTAGLSTSVTLGTVPGFVVQSGGADTCMPYGPVRILALVVVGVSVVVDGAVLVDVTVVGTVLGGSVSVTWPIEESAGAADPVEVFG